MKFSDSRTYYLNLDIIRFLAALWVVVTHFGHIGPYMGTTGYGPTDGALGAFFQYGYLGVPIFFILSGFVIAHVSYQIHPVKFMQNRILRLMPAFWVCMSVSFVFIFLLGSSETLDFKLWLTNLTLLPQVFGRDFVDGVYWTLVLELVFYGWVFLLLCFQIFHRFLLQICAIWLAISLTNLFVLDNSAIELLFATHYAGAFVSGLIMWHAKKNGWRPVHSAIMFFSLISLSYGIMHLGKQEQLPNFTNQPDLFTSAVLAFLSFAIVGLGVILKNINIRPSIIVTLGTISYPLYLIHQEVGYLILQKLGSLGIEPLPSGLSAMVIALVMAYLVHIIFEKPIRSLLRRVMEFILSLIPARAVSPAE